MRCSGWSLAIFNTTPICSSRWIGESAAAMKRCKVIVLLGGIVISLPFAASAQHRAKRIMAEMSCDSFPVGPARTDCYIGLSRISRQKVEISGRVAQQIKNRARYRQIIGQQRYISIHPRKRKSANQMRQQTAGEYWFYRWGP